METGERVVVRKVCPYIGQGEGQHSRCEEQPEQGREPWSLSRSPRAAGASGRTVPPREARPEMIRRTMGSESRTWNKD